MKRLPREKNIRISLKRFAKKKTGGCVSKKKSRNYEPESGIECEPESISTALSGEMAKKGNLKMKISSVCILI
jgi:hypothetical protein